MTANNFAGPGPTFQEIPRGFRPPARGVAS
jgi:hypothetical protein